MNEDKQNEQNELYVVRVDDNSSKPEYLKLEMLGTTFHLYDAGLFSKEELTSVKKLRKNKSAIPIDAIEEIDKKLFTLKNVIDGLKFEKDTLECMKANIKNGTIGQ